MKAIDALKKLGTSRIVTEQKGSWKWQDAYRITYYEATILKNDTVAWVSYSSSRKMSAPQLGSRFNAMDHGSLHHRPIKMNEAAAVIGWSAVNAIVAKGFSFAC